jgi:hypothetical protein
MKLAGKSTSQYYKAWHINERIETEESTIFALVIVLCADINGSANGLL